MPRDFSKIKKDIAAKYGLDEKVVNYIVNYPFIFFKAKVRNVEDSSGIKIPYLGKFHYRQHLKPKEVLAIDRLDTLATKPIQHTIDACTEYNIHVTESDWREILTKMLQENSNLYSAICDKAIHNCYSNKINITQAVT